MGFEVEKTTSWPVRAALWVMLVALAVHLGAGLAGHGARPLIGVWLYDGVEVLAVAVLVWRVVAVPGQRLAWGMLTGYVAMTTTGDIAVCDAYDAMTADRSYRAAMPSAAAIAELRRCAGRQFDPAVVDAFIAASESAPTAPAPSAAPAERV